MPKPAGCCGSFFYFYNMSPLAYCTLCWVVGWLLYPHIDPPPRMFGFAVFLLAYVFHRKTLRWGFVVCVSLLSVCGGYYQARLYDPVFDKSHFIHYTTDKPAAMLVVVQSVRNPTPFSQGFIVEIQQSDKEPTTGRALLQLEQSAELQMGGCYAFTGRLRPIASSKNPGGFDFAKHMRQKGVLAEIQSHSEKLLLVKHKSSLRSWAHQQRNRLTKQLQHLALSKKSEALLKALVLGERSGIDSEMRNTYANAGAVHLLAISGLHVGVLMLLLQWIFAGFRFIPYPWGKWVQTIMVVLCLWGYALLAGLSPSVLRAVTMFSFLTLSRLIDRPGMPFQSLFLSLLVLIGINPRLIYEVGFQLSYTAVAGIMWGMPKLIKLYSPKGVLTNKLWRLWLLGVVAQLSVLPLSLYYFHQFPGLFWVSNLVVVPLLGWVLGTGIFGIIIAHWPQVAALWGMVLEWILGSMNAVVDWIAKQERFLLSEIPFDGWDAWVTAGLVVSLFACLQRITLAKISVVLLFSVLLHISIRHTPYAKEEFLIFHSYQKTLVGIKQSHKVTFYSPKNASPNQKIVDDYALNRHIKEKVFCQLETGFLWGKTPFITVDESGIYHLSKCKGGVVLLCDSPKVHLVDLINTLEPTIIIADGSNYPSFVRHWKKTCLDKGVPFHDTATEGAWIASL